MSIQRDTLKLSRHESGEWDEWMEKEIENYVTSVRYLAFFIDQRRKMGDKTPEELFEEIRTNISTLMVGGFDSLGIH